MTFLHQFVAGIIVLVVQFELYVGLTSPSVGSYGVGTLYFNTQELSGCHILMNKHGVGKRLRYLKIKIIT